MSFAFIDNNKPSICQQALISFIPFLIQVTKSFDMLVITGFQWDFNLSLIIYPQDIVPTKSYCLNWQNETILFIPCFYGQ